MASNVPNSTGGRRLPGALYLVVGVRTELHDGKGSRMSLANAIKQTIQAHDLTTAEIAGRLGDAQDRTTFYRTLNGATKEPRLNTLVQLCIALETSPSDLLELAEMWSPERPGRASPDDLRLRDAFGQARALSQAGKHWAVPLVAALATAWTSSPREIEGGRSADDNPDT